MPNAESALSEINSSTNTFESSNIKETLENAVNDATASLDTLNATTIKNAFVTLESNLNNANYLIKQAKDNTISETQTLIEKAKLATNEKIQSSQELSNELGKDTYLINDKQPGAKKDLDARIQRATTVKDSQDSITSDILSELHKLNLAYNEAKRFKDADDNERNAIIRQIEALKAELESKSSELKGKR